MAVLRELIQLPAVFDQAACLEHDAELWFGDVEQQADAKHICRSCPIQAECLAHAHENQERWGVWGGLDEDERRRLTRRMRRQRG